MTVDMRPPMPGTGLSFSLRILRSDSYSMELKPRHLTSASVLVHWMGVVDANSAGFVHGGTVMKLCDEVAGLAAIRHSRCRVVTARRGPDDVPRADPRSASS